MRVSPEALVRWKVLLFFAGALFFVLGVVLDVRPLVVAAIATLAVAILLRFVRRPPRKEIDPSWYEEGPHTEAQSGLKEERREPR